ncbi:MAG: hypothetical protein ABL936_24110, partial [Aestuariivirga sp.]
VNDSFWEAEFHCVLKTLPQVKFMTALQPRNKHRAPDDRATHEEYCLFAPQWALHMAIRRSSMTMSAFAG